MVKLNLFRFLVLFISIISVASAQETFRDEFNLVSYSNNDGTANFSNDWTERNDDTSPSAGRIRVNSNQLRFRNLDNSDIFRFVPLAGAGSARLTLDYNATARGDEGLQIFIFNADTGTFNLIATINTTDTGSISYDLSAAEIASNPAIFINGTDNVWGNNETVFIDNVQFITTPPSPEVTIANVIVDENAGTATFTATHVGSNTSGPFTVNYQTVDGSANSPIDYTSLWVTKPKLLLRSRKAISGREIP